jgi:hypothetical protein
VNLLLVTFALRNKLRDYDDFFVALRGNCDQWWHFIENTYVVTTVHDPDALTNRLAMHIEPTDSFIVLPVKRPLNGWLPPQAWEWLTEQLSASEQSKLLSG